MASRLEAIASRFEAMASRLEAMARYSRLEAIASRFEAMASLVGSRPWLGTVDWRPSLVGWRPSQVVFSQFLTLLMFINSQRCRAHHPGIIAIGGLSSVGLSGLKPRKEHGVGLRCP